MEGGAVAHLRPVWFRCPCVEKQREDRPRTEGPHEFFTDKHEQVRWHRGDVCLRQEQQMQSQPNRWTCRLPRARPCILSRVAMRAFFQGPLRRRSKEKDEIKQGSYKKDSLDKTR